MHRQAITALLPMKLNSERVPGKNFRLLLGKPLFMWVLDTLLSVESIEKVVINTDARQELVACGLQESDRVVIRDRPRELCGDMVDMNRIINDDICHFKSDIYLMTHTTNPLLSSGTINSAVQKFVEVIESGRYDSLFTVTRHQSRFYDKYGNAVNHNPGELIRTQDLDPLFEENSNLYLFTSESFAKRSARIGEKPLMYEIPKYEAIDIDDPDDFNLAEAQMARITG